METPHPTTRHHRHRGEGNRIPRSLLTSLLAFTPHIPSVCCAAAGPKLRYSRETVAGVRVQHEEKHRGDLYLCHEVDTPTSCGQGGTLGVARHRAGRLSVRHSHCSGSRLGGGHVELHRLEGILEHIVSDLQVLGWWLGRRLAGSEMGTGHNSSASWNDSTESNQQSPKAEEQPNIQTLVAGGNWRIAEDVVPLEIDIKRVSNAHDPESMKRDLRSLLQQLASPPFQVTKGSVVVSCLRSLILTPKQIPLLGNETGPDGCLCLLHSLPLLTRFESFVTQFGSLGPGTLPCLTVLKLRNASLTSLDGLREQRCLRSLDISRCSSLRDVSALAELAELRELNISNSRQLSLACDFSRCTALQSATLRWCQRITNVACVLSAPNLALLDLSYSHVESVAELLQNGRHRCPRLKTLLMRGCADTAALLAALPDSEEEDAEKALEAPPGTVAKFPKLLRQLEHIDVGECDLDDHALHRLAHRCRSLRSLRIRECVAVRTLSALSRVPALEVVDASYTAVSDINGLASCPALRSVTLRDCFRLRNMAPLTKVADSLEQVDASMANRKNVWCRDAREEGGVYMQQLYSPTVMRAAAAKAPQGVDGGDLHSPVLHGLPERLAVERAELLTLLTAPLQPVNGQGTGENGLLAHHQQQHPAPAIW